ncbi:deoxyribodipyrimidine photo-lyase [Roseibium hamelinense]|uniref:Deoxyribodipyrimidine photo-lyase n=2 Tax=Roseibium hamelinense TaxID=150831 RepID=A0A562T906_9HYPH|nr:FAD-binding domain-containing protein [Roseibium hamelinense]TWI90087.1 deoxyribodipyrimidine photo-lyase [Roseibium hamelinense]
MTIMTDAALFDTTSDRGFAFLPTRRAAEARLQAFLPSAGKAYASKRNYDFGPDDRSNISALSPYIRHRLLLEQEVLKATLVKHSPSSAEKFIQEVFWRGYFKGWLEHRPDAWTRYRADVQHLARQLEDHGGLRKAYEQAVSGATGIDCFDAWAHELVETGYLHNHARMWFASIWIFTLGLPWQLGADFFYRHLLDGDPASNTLSWRWVGGLHTKGKTYQARASNIDTYTASRFSYPQGLAPSAPPLDEEPLGPRVPIRLADMVPDTDSPALLLITEEDCHPHTWQLGGARPVAATGLLATSKRSPLEMGEKASAFAFGAVNEGLEQAQQVFGIECSGPKSSDDWAASLIEAAAAANTETIVTAFAAIGPVQDQLEGAKPHLEAAGIRLIQVRRPYDDLTWPHATAGFFKLKTKIPKILEGLGLGR